MPLAVLIHSYTAPAGIDTTQVGGASLVHTLQVLAALEQPVLSVLPEHQLPALSAALRHCPVPSGSILHPGRLGSNSALMLAALQLLTPGHDPVLFICQNPLRLSHGERLLQLVQQGTAAAEAGALVSLATRVPLNGQPAARHQLLVAQHPTQGLHTVQSAGRNLPPASGGELRLHATGAYLARASTVLQTMEQLAPAGLAACRQAMAQARRGRVVLAAQARHPTAHNEPRCVWPEATSLQRAGSADMEHKLLRAHPHHVVLPSDGCWLPSAQPLPQATPVRLALARRLAPAPT